MLEIIVSLTLLLTSAGMDKKEVVCSLELVKKESNYNLHSVNSKSGAYGLFQLMRVNKKLPIEKQVDRYVRYLDHRYKGNACLALSHLRLNNWY